MTRAVAMALALTFAAPAAHANPFTLLAKGAKLAAKAGKAGKVAKAGAVAKGAKLVTAGVAAERVFAHAPLSAERVAVFVTNADDGLKAVVRGSDDVVGGADVGKVIGELDEMGAVAPDAGVDLFVDPSALDDLAELPIGANTRVFVANVDGPSWPLEELLVGDEVVAVARVEEGLGIRAVRHADLAVNVMQLNIDLTGADVVVPDVPCADALEAAIRATGFDVGVDRGPVVVLGDDPAMASWAAEQGIDLVALGLADVCAVDEAGELRVIGHLRALRAAKTWADVWAIPGTDAVPALVSEVSEVAHAVVVTAAGADRQLRTIVAVSLPDVVEGPVQKVLNFLCGLACVGVIVLALIGAVAEKADATAGEREG